jgi:large subunit ribosomal protein L24
MNNVVKCHIKKGDSVVVIAGDDKGKSGKVLQILPQSGRALVEGVNFVKKHMRKTDDNPQGGIVDMEAPIAISNLKVSK